MLLFSFNLSLIMKVLPLLKKLLFSVVMKVMSLLKKLLFSVVLLYSLPGASFFLKRSPNTKTFSPISRGSLRRFLCLSTFVSNVSVRSPFF